MATADLAASLAGRIDPALPVFILVDPMLGEPIPVTTSGVEIVAFDAQREAAWGRPIERIELDPRIDLVPHLHPYLVALRDAADPWLELTMQIASEELDLSRSNGLAGPGHGGHRIGGWIQSSLAPPLLAAALGKMMNVSTQAQTPARYQRLADRRAFAWLRYVVGDERMGAQLGRIRCWWYLDACGGLARVGSRSEVAVPLRLTSLEWADFMQGELLHASVARWLGEAPRPGQSVHPDQESAAFARAQTALKQSAHAAQRWPQRFGSTGDRTAWAALMLLHPGIELEATVATILSMPAEPDEALETMNDLAPALSWAVSRAIQ